MVEGEANDRAGSFRCEAAAFVRAVNRVAEDRSLANAAADLPKIDEGNDIRAAGESREARAESSQRVCCMFIDLARDAGNRVILSISGGFPTAKVVAVANLVGEQRIDVLWAERLKLQSFGS